VLLHALKTSILSGIGSVLHHIQSCGRQNSYFQLPAVVLPWQLRALILIELAACGQQLSCSSCHSHSMGSADSSQTKLGMFSAEKSSRNTLHRSVTNLQVLLRSGLSQSLTHEQ
jgi:hypothetical protein